MKDTMRFFGIIAVIVIIGFSFSSCGGGGGDNYTFDSSLGSGNIGKKGPAGGIIFYYNAIGFTVTGAGSFTANYLEAAPANQGTSLQWASPSYLTTDITGTLQIIGAGKANTSLILATDANAPAAKACANYRGGSKKDWFLPSRDELNALWLSSIIVPSGNFWSSSQAAITPADAAFYQRFSDGSQSYPIKSDSMYVRAIRAF